MPDYAEAAEAKGYVKIGTKWSHPDHGAVNHGTAAKPDWRLSPGAKVWWNPAQIWNDDLRVQSRPLSVEYKREFDRRLEAKQEPEKKAKKE